jgi:hypothetical protein
VENDLVKRGVSRQRAKSLAARYPEAHIRAKLEEFDYRMTREEGDPLRPQNPGGYLSQAIEEDYASPKGFKSQADVERERQEKEAQSAQRKAAKEAKAKEEAERKANAELEFQRKSNLVTQYLAALSAEERQRVERDALASSLFGATAGEVIRQSIIHNHVLEMLKRSADDAKNITSFAVSG